MDSLFWLAIKARNCNPAKIRNESAVCGTRPNILDFGVRFCQIAQIQDGKKLVWVVKFYNLQTQFIM
jgi:hypothetical protein